jgi:hypothetical protein
MALYSACVSIGFGFTDTLKIVEQYATRNELLHTNLKISIQNGEWDIVKHILSDDIRNIPLTHPVDSTPSARLLLKLLSPVDKWFNRDPGRPDSTHEWVASQSLRDYSTQLQGKTAEEKEKLRKKMANEVLKLLRQKQKDEKAEKALNETLGEELVIGLKIKRVASSHFVEEGQRLKRQRRDWNLCQKLSYNQRKVSSDYARDYGELISPPDEVVHDPSLDFAGLEDLGDDEE